MHLREKGIHAARVEPDDADNALFCLQDLGNGRYSLGYRDNTLPAGLKAGTKTVRLNVFLKGNVSGQPNAVTALKISFR